MWQLTTVVLLASCFGWSESYIRVFNRYLNESLYTVEEKMVISFHIPPEHGAVGGLVIANPENACTCVQKVPHPGNDTFSWFLLVRRYNCTFDEKLINAQRGGYAGVIIYDTDKHHSLGRPYGFPDLNVYAVLVSKKDGLALGLFTFKKGYTLAWFPSSEFNLLGYILPCIVIVLLCILMIACLVVAQHCTRWYRERRRNTKYRLAKKYLKQLPVKKWTKGSPEFENYDQCSICLDEYQEGHKLRVLPCQHAYHPRCIDPWLTKNRRNCPLCKRKIVLPGMPEDSSDDETAPLTITQQDTNGGTFENDSTRVLVRQVEVDVEDGTGTATLPHPTTYAPGGHYSVNDEVEVLPRRKPRKKRRPRRTRELLDDANAAGPSSSVEHAPENQMSCVTEIGSDDEQPLLREGTSSVS